ncbi:MAG: hypothetical protein M1826_004314 [Phylliscum demangeonii]|nr:MAG: hypothetical protein M1826_004314 [Phylliscum demangeonii]
MHLKSIRGAWPTEASGSPTSKILRQLAYGKAVIKTEGTAAVVNWSSDGQTLWFDGQQIALQAFRACIQATVAETGQALAELMFDDRPTIDLGAIQDSLSWEGKYNAAGCSFVNASNGFDQGFRYQLRRAIAAPDRLLSPDADGVLQYLERPCLVFLRRERRFLDRLMCCFHLCGGQPARAPELGSLKVCNTPYTARGLYIVAGEVVFITSYDKNMARRDDVESVLRFLPPAVGILLVRYLVFVRPFARALPANKRHDHYLFATTRGPFTDRQATPALKSVTKRFLGYAPDGLGFAAYRHVAIAIARRHCRKEYQDWHDCALDDGSSRDKEDNIFDCQAGHSRRTAEQHYAVQAGFLHRIQQPQGPHCPDPQPAVKRARLTSPSALTSTVADEMQQAKSGEQQDAMQFVLQTQDASIVVLRTAGGKSLLFLGTATLQADRITIVIVPYLALRTDLLMRAKTHGIHAQQWSAGAAGGASLMVVSADVAVTAAFQHYATDLALHGRLRHIFFDECHVAITETSFRGALQWLWLLRNIPAPFTCLTATLPPALEMQFREQLLLNDVPIFRRSTERPSIGYGVVDYRRDPGQTLLSCTLDYARVKQAIWTSHQRGIVYVRSMADGERVAAALGCSFYTARAV